MRFSRKFSTTRRLSLLLLILALLLAACGGDDDDEGNDNDSDTQNDSSGNADRDDALALSETASNESDSNGSVTLQYPEGWLVDFDGPIAYIATNQAALDKMKASEPPAFAAGEAALQTFPVGSRAELEASGQEFSLMALFVLIRGQIAEGNTREDGTTIAIGEPHDTTVGSQAALVATIISEPSIGDGVLYVVQTTPDLISYAIAITSTGELAQYQATWEAIIASLVVSEPEAPSE